VSSEEEEEEDEEEPEGMRDLTLSPAQTPLYSSLAQLSA